MFSFSFFFFRSMSSGEFRRWGPTHLVRLRKGKVATNARMEGQSRPSLSNSWLVSDPKYKTNSERHRWATLHHVVASLCQTVYIIKNGVIETALHWLIYSAGR